jgi:steroid delta-isomerase-like uncharacterized protein
MPNQNEAVVRRFVDEVWNKGNLKLIDELLASDYVNHDPVNPTRGPDAERETIKKYRAAFPDCRLDIDDLISIGDRVVVRYHYSGTHEKPLEGIAPTGRHVTGPGLSIHKFVGNRIQESHNVWDALGLMRQLGVFTMPGKTFQAGV